MRGVCKSAGVRGLGQTPASGECGERDFDAQPQHVGPEPHACLLDEEVAKAIGRKARGVMTRRTHVAKCGGDFATGHQLGPEHCRPGSVPRSSESLAIHGGIGIDEVITRFGCGSDQLGHVERIVYPFDLRA